MAITLKDYLQNVYPKRTGYTGKKTPVLNDVTTNNKSFELCDAKRCHTATFITSGGNTGEACFYNLNNVDVYIVNFESYIDSYTQSNSAGRKEKCDLILTSASDYNFIVLNELSTGKRIENKLEHAIEQFNDSIEKLSENKFFLLLFKQRIALLSYKLTDTNSSSLVAQSIAKFGLPTRATSKNISLQEVLKRGFVFEQRIYPDEFELPS